MIKHGLEEINLNNPIENKLPQIIEYFVEFYGEKYRERITNRINNTLFIFVDKPNSNRFFDINYHFDGLRRKLFNNFSKALGFPIYDDGYPLHRLTLEQLEALKDWQNDFNNEDYYNVANFLKHLDCNYNIKRLKKDLKDGKKEEICKKFAKIYEVYAKSFKENLSYLESERTRLTSTESVKRWAGYIDKAYDEEIDKVLKENLIKNFKLSKNNEKINEFLPIYRKFVLKSPEFISKSQLQEMAPMLEYLAKEAGINEENISEIIQNTYFMTNISAFYLDVKIAEINKRRENEYSPIISGYSENMSKLYQKEYFLEEDIISHIKEYCATPLHQGGTIAFTYPAIDLSKKNETINVCVCGTYFNLYDSNIIHEINHAIESDYQLKDGNLYQKTGFDYSVTNLSTNRQVESSGCLLLNEVINDYLSLKVLSLMQKDNFSIGYQVKRPSSYSKAFPFLKKFIEDNLQDIIDCRMSDNPYAFAEKIGMDNFRVISECTVKLLELCKVYPFEEAREELQVILNDDKEGIAKLSNSAKMFLAINSTLADTIIKIKNGPTNTEESNNQQDL